MSTSDRFHITCPGCNTQVAVSKAHIGKKGRCPTCKTVFPIASPAAPEPVVAELIPMAADLQPLGSPGLQPLVGSGLQPLPAPGLQPLPGPGLQTAAWPGQQAQWQGSAIPNPYGHSVQASPFGQPASSQPAFGQPSSPFAQPSGDGELRLAPAPNPYAAPAQAGSPFQFAPAKPQPQSSGGEINGSLWGGMGLMALAVVWFVGGLFFDIIFFYPPILFIIGLIGFVKGLVNLGSNR